MSFNFGSSDSKGESAPFQAAHAKGQCGDGRYGDRSIERSTNFVKMNSVSQPLVMCLTLSISNFPNKVTCNNEVCF